MIVFSFRAVCRFDSDADMAAQHTQQSLSLTHTLFGFSIWVVRHPTVSGGSGEFDLTGYAEIFLRVTHTTHTWDSVFGLSDTPLCQGGPERVI